MPDKSTVLPMREEILQRLRGDFNYTEMEAEALVGALNRSRDEVKRAFAEWWTTGRLDTVEVEGWTASRIADHLGCAAPAAIVNLDWLLTDPIAAKAAFQRGFDRVVSREGPSNG